ncbi:hypothetical protein VOLCADRAFT_96643 [Volvox carteri f. nagariensis]|uniref:Uncharacterized protein n=1 Tax=Volvox carteri f. nagariensis TaxID=3068 RepID=D8UAN5_VOLCA|nr:uncharacterized protein VOLCADRAFT_96643 [Volvox carteri f. nagariensis]EFJ43184.1 hypothetical protein VOLCADRAFT_96643 [Volvox carteri f. nagariensis]|eukprot:XP_002955759.1 hypothetical protein VOLCADRAFT_96643 [Volvox carteri f. nagariensis]
MVLVTYVFSSLRRIPVIPTLDRKIQEVESQIEATEDALKLCKDKDELAHLREKERQLREEKRQLREEKRQLREEKLKLRDEELLRLKMQSSASGLGVGSTAGADLLPLAASAAAGLGLGILAGAGAPAPRRLVDSAAKLHYKVNNNDIVELHYSDSVLSYIDVARVDTARMDKTGKSFTLEHVVPAVVAEVLRQQGGEGPLAGMVALRLNCGLLQRQASATAMLRDLLGMLLSWARKEHVPMQEGALEAAEDVLGRRFFSTDRGLLGHTIREFLKAVEVPVLVLCDEMQSLFLPTIDGKLDASGAAYIRNSFMKLLLVYGSHTMLWCITGSSMVQTWISLADMPPNGYTVITGASAVNLPATYRPEHMSLAWELLKSSKAGVQLDPKLLELCPPSIALLTVLVEDWIDALPPLGLDVTAFIRGFMRMKLIDESRKEWKLGLEGMSLLQRITVLDLAFPDVGARIDTDLHPGLQCLQRFLEPHLERKTDGRYYFRDPHQRQIVRLVINQDGTLRESWSSLEFSATLMQLDTMVNLLRLGEAADYLLGPRASLRWEREKPPAGMDEFTAKLQAIADKTATKLASDQGGVVLGLQELWERQSWFQKVLSSKWNDRLQNDYKQARCTHLAMLVFYLRLSRNVLVHAKPWDQEHDIPVNVDVIEALPRVLGQSLLGFNDDIVRALRVLSRHTMEKDTQFRAQLSGSGGGSIEGLTDDEGSSSGGLSGSTGSSSSGAQPSSSSGTQPGGSSGTQPGNSSGTRPGGSSGTQPGAVAPGLGAAVAPRLAAAVAPHLASAVAPGLVAAVAPGLVAAVAPSLATAVAPRLAAAVAPGLGAAVAPGLGAAVAPSLATAVAPGLGAAVAPHLAAAVAPGLGAAVAPRLAAAVAPRLATAVAPGLVAAVAPRLAAAVAPGLGAAVAPGLGAAVAPGLGAAVAPRLATAVAPGLGAAVAPHLATAVAPRLGAALAVVPRLAAAVVPRLGAAVAPGLGAAVAPGLGAAVAPGLGAAVAPGLGAAVAPGLGAAVAPRLATAVAPRLATAVAPRLAAAVAPGLGAAVAPGLGAAVAPGLGAAVAPRLATAVAPGLGAAVAPHLATAVAPRLGAALAVVPRLAAAVAPRLGAAVAPSLAAAVAPMDATGSVVLQVIV